MDRLRRYLLLLVVSAALLGSDRPVAAAERSITLTAPVGVVRVGDLVTVDVLVTNLTQAINAVDLTIQYPAAQVRIVDISRAKSALTLWPQAPSWDATSGTIHLVGGLPNGMYAKDARVATITLSASSTGSAVLALETQQSLVFLNDGRGTSALLPASSMTLEVVSDLTPTIAITSPTHPTPGKWYADANVQLAWEVQPQTQYSYAWSGSGQLAPDTIPDDITGVLSFDNLADGRYSFTIQSRPEGGSWSAVTQRWFLIDRTRPESIIIQQLPVTAVGGDEVLRWNAVDAMSGASSRLRIGRHEIGQVTSPLSLDPQWQGKTLVITVTDLAGNSQTATWSYPGGWFSWWWLWAGGAMVIASFCIILVVVRRRR